MIAMIAISVSGAAVPTAARTLPTAPSPSPSRWPSHSTALVKSRAPPSTIAKATMISSSSIASGEVEGETEDRVHGQELDALEPGRLAVLDHVVGDQDRDHDRAQLEAVEDERQRIRADEVGGDDEDRGDEEGDLAARADRDVDRQVHLVLAGDEDSDPVLGRVADDRDDDDADEELGEADRFGGFGDRADQHLGHDPDEDARDRQGDHRGFDRPAPAVLLLVVRIEEVAVRPQREDEPEAVGDDEDDRDGEREVLD